jgi:hypothetical protein
MWEELWAKAVLAESRLRCTGSERAAPVEADMESKPEPPVETSPASYPCGHPRSPENAYWTDADHSVCRQCKLWPTAQ